LTILFAAEVVVTKTSRFIVMCRWRRVSLHATSNWVVMRSGRGVLLHTPQEVTTQIPGQQTTFERREPTI